MFTYNSQPPISNHFHDMDRSKRKKTEKTEKKLKFSNSFTLPHQNAPPPPKQPKHSTKIPLIPIYTPKIHYSNSNHSRPNSNQNYNNGNRMNHNYNPNYHQHQGEFNPNRPLPHIPHSTPPSQPNYPHKINSAYHSITPPRDKHSYETFFGKLRSDPTVSTSYNRDSYYTQEQSAQRAVFQLLKRLKIRLEQSVNVYCFYSTQKATNIGIKHQ